MNETTNRARRPAVWWALPFLAFALYAALALCLRGMHRTASLRLPDAADLALIAVTSAEHETQISAPEELGAVIGLLLGGGRTSAQESVQDAPVGAENTLKIDFIFSGGGASTLFAYEKGGGCWLEQPYNGIYALSREEFDALARLLPA